MPVDTTHNKGIHQCRRQRFITSCVFGLFSVGERSWAILGPDGLKSTMCLRGLSNCVVVVWPHRQALSESVCATTETGCVITGGSDSRHADWHNTNSDIPNEVSSFSLLSHLQLQCVSGLKVIAVQGMHLGLNHPEFIPCFPDLTLYIIMTVMASQTTSIATYWKKMQNKCFDIPPRCLYRYQPMFTSQAKSVPL